MSWQIISLAVSCFTFIDWHFFSAYTYTYIQRESKLAAMQKSQPRRWKQYEMNEDTNKIKIEALKWMCINFGDMQKFVTLQNICGWTKRSGMAFEVFASTFNTVSLSMPSGIKSLCFWWCNTQKSIKGIYYRSDKVDAKCHPAWNENRNLEESPETILKSMQFELSIEAKKSFYGSIVVGHFVTLEVFESNLWHLRRSSWPFLLINFLKN